MYSLTKAYEYNTNKFILPEKNFLLTKIHSNNDKVAL